MAAVAANLILSAAPEQESGVRGLEADMELAFAVQRNFRKQKQSVR
jgi:hypothetical protein